MTEEKDFAREGIPNLDELAMRLDVAPAEEPYHGLILWSKSGRVYSLTDIIYNLTEFVAQALTMMVSLVEEVNQDEPSKRTGRSKKTDNPTGGPKSDKS